MTSGAPRLEVSELTVTAGKLTLVDRVSFVARAGQVLVVVGPNGAGKTSLFEAVLGVRSHSGAIRIDGSTRDGFGARARAIAFLPDRGELPPEATVKTLVDDAQRWAKPSPPDLAKALGIEALLGRPTGVLSHGERGRVALYLALVLGRPISLLDEPFSAFDPVQLSAVLDVVRAAAKAGTAIVASVHQLADAEKIADRILLLARGRRIAEGSLAELRERTGAVSLEEAFVQLLKKADDAA